MTGKILQGEYDGIHGMVEYKFDNLNMTAGTVE